MSSKKKPLIYFLSQFGPNNPLNYACPSCETTTTFSSQIHLSTSKDSDPENYYQCQKCGKLETSNEKGQDGTRVGLEIPCECGGQFRRDKNIFCPNCQDRKFEDNKAEDNLIATEAEIESLSKIHGSEEMAFGFHGQKDESGTEEEAEYEEPDFKKLISELREITSDGSTFNFEVSPNGKGNEYLFNVGLDYELESVLANWLDIILVPDTSYISAEFKLTIKDNIICLDCSTTCKYWQDLNKYENKDLFTLDIVKILLPDYEFEDVDLEALSLPFRYTQNNKGYHFYWPFFTADYYDNRKELYFEIPLDDLKSKLEPLLHEILINFDSGDSIDHDDSCTKMIEVLDGRISILETYEYSLSFDIEDF
jgi:hypothetical protein